MCFVHQLTDVVFVVARVESVGPAVRMQTVATTNATHIGANAYE